MSLSHQILHEHVDLYRVPSRIEVPSMLSVHSCVFLVNNICVLVLLLLSSWWVSRVKGFQSLKAQPKPLSKKPTPSTTAPSPSFFHSTNEKRTEKVEKNSSFVSPDASSSSDEEEKENHDPAIMNSDPSAHQQNNGNSKPNTTRPSNIQSPSHFLFESSLLSPKSTNSSSHSVQYSTALLIFRACACVWSHATLLLYQLVFIRQSHLTFFSFLTNATFVVFTLYFSCHTVIGIIVHYGWFKTSEGKQQSEDPSILESAIWTKQGLNVIWILGELMVTSCIIVCVGFWVMAPFEPYKPLRMDGYFNYAFHGVVGIFAVTEFLLSNLHFRFWHVFIIAMYPIGFFLWVQLLAESRLIELFPYCLSNYFTHPFTSSIVYTFGMPLVFIVTFCMLCKLNKLKLVRQQMNS